MNRGSGIYRKINVGVRRERTLLRASKRGFYSFFAYLWPSGIRSAVQKATIGTFLGVILKRKLANGAIKTGIAKMFDHNSSFFASNSGDLVFTFTMLP